jgi:hypothetical protein
MLRDRISAEPGDVGHTGLYPWALVVGCTLIAAILGSSLTWNPIIAAVPVVPLTLVGLLYSSAVRFAFVTFGGLVVLQSSEGIDARKVAYLAGCALAFGIAFARTSKLDTHLGRSVLRRFVIISAGWTLLVALSFPVAIYNGSALMDWVRDSIPYLLIAASPFMAIDWLIDLRVEPDSTVPMRMFVIFGLLTTLSFALTWISRRDYAGLGLERQIFSTFIFPCALLSYAVAKSFSSQSSNIRWAALASAIFFAFILTGTRTSLVMLAAPMVILAGQGGDLRRKLPRLIVFLAAAIAVGLVSLSLLPQQLGVDTDFIYDRFSSINEITGDSVAGQSYDERTVQTGLTRDTFLSSPVFGVGPGHVYEWLTPYSDTKKSAFVLDSPMSIPAKFGATGYVVFLFTLATLYVLQRRLNRLGYSARVERDAVRGFLAIVLLLSLLSSPIDDKGFSFALAFILVLSVQRVITVEQGATQSDTIGIDSVAVLQPSSLAQR